MLKIIRKVNDNELETQEKLLYELYYYDTYKKEVGIV